MIFLQNCPTYILYGMVLRVVCTFVTFYLIKTNASHENIYLALPIALLLLDFIDNAFFLIPQFSKGDWIIEDTNCPKQSNTTQIYKFSDKIIDILSYVFCYVYFYDDIKDSILELFIIYRLIGVICFTSVYNNYFLVIFFDFVKEFMLYKYFFKTNYMLLPFFIILKIIFEYKMHIHIWK